jgi:trimethylamine---corrinoid protein Co-methyltransferase
VSFLAADELKRVLVEAREVLAEVGIIVELSEVLETLRDAGARVGADGRVRIDDQLVERTVASVPGSFLLHDRDGGNSFELGAGTPHYCPGSAAIRVLDWGAERMRPSILADCESFAHLTEALPAYAFQSTCVVPTDLPPEEGDHRRLAVALTHCTKPIITGTFHRDSFEVMRRMLECVRGGAGELAEKPLAIFDCCPTAPLIWSELTSSALTGCARSGIPAELISVPMTGATAPVTLWGSLVQHTAENLSGVVIHQLAAPGAPLVWGSCASGFDMRRGTSPMGAVESMMLNAAAAEIGRHLGLPTHGYYALSDSKCLDYQAGMESGSGALLAALSGVDVISGPGILEFVGCQSLEKLVLDHEACRMARRALRGLEPSDAGSALEVIREGVAAGQFLDLDHTRDNFRAELLFPGAPIDRRVEESWFAAGAERAEKTAHREVERLLANGPSSSLAPELAHELAAFSR